MKKTVKNFRLIICLIACCAAAVMLGGCRVIKHFTYPHTLAGEVHTFGAWQEVPLDYYRFDERESTNVYFNLDGRTVCLDPAKYARKFHLCSPSSAAEFKRLSKERFKDYDSPARINPILNLVEKEPLPDLEIELVSESGEVSQFQNGYFTVNEPNLLQYQFRDCAYGYYDEELEAAGVDEREAKYSDEEFAAHARKCAETRAKRFVKMRLRSPSGINIESITVVSADPLFSIR